MRTRSFNGLCQDAIAATQSVGICCLAVQCVVQALQLLRGHNAVIPTLQNAAEQYHAQRAAPMDEISALLSQVTLQAEQQQVITGCGIRKQITYVVAPSNPTSRISVEYPYVSSANQLPATNT